MSPENIQFDPIIQGESLDQMGFPLPLEALERLRNDALAVLENMELPSIKKPQLLVSPTVALRRLGVHWDFSEENPFVIGCSTDIAPMGRSIVADFQALEIESGLRYPSYSDRGDLPWTTIPRQGAWEVGVIDQGVTRLSTSGKGSLIGCRDRTQVFIPPTALATFEHMKALEGGNNWHRKVPDSILVGISNGRFCYRTFAPAYRKGEDLFDWVILSDSVDAGKGMIIMRRPYVPLFESIDLERYRDVRSKVSSISWDRYFSLPKVSDQSYCSQADNYPKTIKFRLNDLAPRDGRTLDIQDQVAAATSYVVLFLMHNFYLSTFDENIKQDIYNLVAGDTPGSLVFPLETSSVELNVERHDNHADVTIEIKGFSSTRSNCAFDVSRVHEFVTRQWGNSGIF